MSGRIWLSTEPELLLAEVQHCFTMLPVLELWYWLKKSLGRVYFKDGCVYWSLVLYCNFCFRKRQKLFAKWCNIKLRRMQTSALSMYFVVSLHCRRRKRRLSCSCVRTIDSGVLDLVGLMELCQCQKVCLNRYIGLTRFLGPRYVQNKFSRQNQCQSLHTNWTFDKLKAECWCGFPTIAQLRLNFWTWKILNLERIAIPFLRICLFITELLWREWRDLCVTRLCFMISKWNGRRAEKEFLQAIERE